MFSIMSISLNYLIKVVLSSFQNLLIGILLILYRRISFRYFYPVFLMAYNGFVYGVVAYRRVLCTIHRIMSFFPVTQQWLSFYNYVNCFYLLPNFNFLGQVFPQPFCSQFYRAAGASFFFSFLGLLTYIN